MRIIGISIMSLLLAAADATWEYQHSGKKLVVTCVKGEEKP